MHRALSPRAGTRANRRNRLRAGALVLALVAGVAGVEGLGASKAVATDFYSGAVDATGANTQWFTIPITVAPTRVMISLDWTNAAANLSLYLKNPSGVQVTSAQTPGVKPQALQYNVPTGGNWKVAVRARTGASAFSFTVDQDPSRYTVLPTYVRTIGGSGTAEMYPSGLTVGPDNTLYIADTANDQVAAYSDAGAQLWRTGFRGTNPKALGRMQQPRDIAYLNGKLYVADLANNRVQVFSAATGTPLAIWPQHFVSIIGISSGVDANGHPIILATDNQANAVRIFDPNGVLLWSIATTPGAGQGQLNDPRDAATDSSGNIFVADYANDRMAEFGPTGTWIRNWGSKGPGPGQFGRPYGVDVDDAGNVYVADSNNERLQKFTGTGTYLATYGGVWSFTGLRRVAVEHGPNPRVLGADLWGYRVVRFAPDGSVNRIFGGSAPPSGGFNELFGVASDGSRIFAMDTDNQRVQRFAFDGTFQLSWGDRGFGDGNTGFNWARDITYSTTLGTVWVADTKNNRLTEFSPDGAATGRIIGRLGSAPGRLWWPYGLAAYQDKIVVADTNNNRVQMLDPKNGAVVWVATGFNHPKAVSVSGTTIAVADSLNARVVRLDAATGAQVDTFGSGVLHRTDGVAIAPDGTVWASDSSVNSIVEFNRDGSFGQRFGRSGNAPGQFIGPSHLQFVQNGAQLLLLVADTENDRIQVFDVTRPDIAPVAAFTWFCSGTTCIFDGRPSSDADGAITNFRWDYGDGSVDAGEQAAHTYASSGTFTVQLTVTDNVGVSTSISIPVTTG